MHRILVVEDDRDIAELVCRYLEKAGFTAELVTSGAAGLSSIAASPPDLLVLDLMLPHVDGLEICRAVRANEKTAAMPIIMLTARAEESERIVGLEIGADDYIAKPFSPNELVARVRALLRRAHRKPSAAARLRYGSITVDSDRHTGPAERRVGHADRQGVSAARISLKHHGRVLSRDVLLTDVWGYKYTGGTRTVDVHVRRLREKLPALEKALVTVKQFGYKLLDQPPELTQRREHFRRDSSSLAHRPPRWRSPSPARFSRGDAAPDGRADRADAHRRSATGRELLGDAHAARHRRSALDLDRRGRPHRRAGRTRA